MFELLFKYPVAVFSRGTFVLLGSWPRWILPLAIIAAAGALGFAMWRTRGGPKGAVQGWRALTLWLLQSALLTLLLLLLWQPAISVTSLKPQQNIVAVLVDDSRSMTVKEGSETRAEHARRLLDSGLLNRLGQRFQVRLYRLGAGVQQITRTSQL